ncbi:MAG: aggregation-promoting factor C-terminal-like domain-containing protein [Nitrospiria bacterium]
MAQAGIPQSDWGYVDYIITRESGWRVNAREPHTGAFGLPQALPASKMASAGSDYLTDPITQLSWANRYALDRYSGWAGAYQHWLSWHWW